MWLTLLEEFLPLISAALKTAIKNPKAYGSLKNVIQEINNDTTSLLAGM